MSQVDRRDFVRLTGASITTLLLGACDARGPKAAERILRYAERKNEGIERWLMRHTSMDHTRASWRTAGAGFPAYYAAPTVPIWDAAVRGAWTLEVGGMVERPMTFTLAQLAALPRTTQRVNHYCVEGWTAVAEWSGVRLSALASLVRPAREAQFVDFQSFDAGYHESWDLETALHPQSLIAYAMDGRWLGAAHGAPARVHSPVKLGYKNTKYLTKVLFMPRANGGYWSDEGYEWYGGT